MATIVISITPTGGMQALHSDAFPLSSIGTEVQMERASTIEWDEYSQTWEVTILNTSISIDGFPSYSQARDFEVEFLNTCRERELPLDMEEAWRLAYTLSGNYGGQ